MTRAAERHQKIEDVEDLSPKLQRDADGCNTASHDQRPYGGAATDKEL
jgi:hypothetical protein